MIIKSGVLNLPSTDGDVLESAYKVTLTGIFVRFFNFRNVHQSRNGWTHWRYICPRGRKLINAHIRRTK